MDMHWRNTQKPVRFFFMDARAFFAVLFYLCHARVWVLCLAAFIIFLFWAFERRGLMFGSALRAMRSWFVGRWRPSNSRRAARRLIDNGAR